MTDTTKEFEYFIVVLTNSGKLVSDHVVASSFSRAFDRFLAVHDLAGQVADHKFCVKRDRTKHNDG